MGYNTTEKLMENLLTSYLYTRDTNIVLSCLTDEVIVVGTEKETVLKGKEAVARFVEKEVSEYEKPFGIKIENVNEQRLREDIVVITYSGYLAAIPGVVNDTAMRCTICCVLTDSGWLVSNVHLSVPNSEYEKYTLQLELNENRKKEQTLMAGIPGGVAIYRQKKSGIVETEYVSEGLAKMCGYTAEEFLAYIKKDAMVNLVKEDIPQLVSTIGKSLIEDKPISTTYRIYKKDGTPILIRLDANVIKSEIREDEDAVWYGVHTIVSEETIKSIQEQKTQLEAALKEAEAANKTKSEFLSRMSHDLRTPINAIMGLAALTMDDASKPEIVHENMTKMHSASVFMLNLVNDLLDMERIEEHSIQFNMAPYTYSDFEMSLKMMFQPQCEEKGIQITFEEAPSDVTVLTDSKRLNQIFNNIISNAVKYTNPGGHISFTFENIKISKDSFSCDYIIEDDGIGMSKEYQKHLFEPFMQEDNRVTPELQGSGLGLSITKQLVELMGGSISIESEKNKGTKVRISLSFKMLDYNTKKQKKVFATENNNYELSGKHILLAEDHPLNAEIARKLLEKKGASVSRASDGVEVVNMFKVSDLNSFDAILMDIRMPEMSGFEAAREIRRLDRLDAKTVPIIAMSANAYQRDIDEGINAGMNEYITKPVEPEKLYETLSKSIKNKNKK